MSTTDGIYVDQHVFHGGPPLRLQRSLGLVKPGQPRVAKRALFAALIAWTPLALLATAETILFSRPIAKLFFADFAVHARYWKDRLRDWPVGRDRALLNHFHSHRDGATSEDFFHTDADDNGFSGISCCHIGACSAAGRHRDPLCRAITRRKIAKPISILGTVLLVLAALPVLIASFSSIISVIGNGTILALAAFVIIALVVGHLLGS